MTDQTGVLFVCLGNICRSPLAEAIFTHLADERGVADQFDIDSCGTGHWHVGGPADARSIEVGARHGIPVTSRARQFDPDTDPNRFSLFISMDRANHSDLIELGAAPGKVHLMRSFDQESARANDLDVPDPYYGPGDGFQRVFDMLHVACGGLLDQLQNKHAR